MSDEQTYELAHIVNRVEALESGGGGSVDPNHDHPEYEDKAASEARDENLQDQIDGLVMLSAAGEWLVRIGGSNPPAGEMIINSMDWTAVTFIWLSDEDQAGTTHNFDFLDAGDRIRITQGDSFGSYRVVDRDEDKDGAYVTVVPVLTGLAGTVNRDQTAALTLEDSNGSGSGGGGGSHTHSEYASKDHVHAASATFNGFDRVLYLGSGSGEQWTGIMDNVYYFTTDGNQLQIDPGLLEDSSNSGAPRPDYLIYMKGLMILTGSASHKPTWEGYVPRPGTPLELFRFQETWVEADWLVAPGNASMARVRTINAPSLGAFEEITIQPATPFMVEQWHQRFEAFHGETYEEHVARLALEDDSE